MTPTRKHLSTSLVAASFVVCIGLAVYPSAGVADERSSLSFNRDVRPLLSDRCLACHGPDAAHREAELRLDDRASGIQDRAGYAVIVPGQPDASELIARITSTDEDLVMPPPHLSLIHI